VRVALQDAASVASLLITTEAMIAEKPKDKAPMGMPGGGGMGGGDLKLGAMLGAFLGWKVVLVALFVGVVCGGALAIVLLASGRSGRKDPIPFGPFLAAGGAVALFWGDRIVAWYTGGFSL